MEREEHIDTNITQQLEVNFLCKDALAYIEFKRKTKRLVGDFRH